MSTKIVSLTTARNYVQNSPRGAKIMFKDANLSDVEAYYVGQNIWKGIPPESLMFGVDPTKGLDPENFNTEVVDALHKSLNNVAKKQGDHVAKTAITSTSAQYFIPTFIDPTLIDVVKRKTPYLALVPKKTMAGQTANVPRRTAGVTPEFLTDAGGAITINAQTYNDVNATVKFLYAAGQVTGPAERTSETTINLLQANIQHTFLDLQQYKESILMRGRISAGTKGWAGGYLTVAQGYDGIFKRVHEDASQNETELAGGASIEVGDIDDMAELIIDGGGNPDFGVCDTNTAKELMRTARTHQRLGSHEINIGAPIGKIEIDGIPIFSTTQLPRTANNRSIFLSDMRAAELRVLQPDTYREVAQTMNDTKQYFWKCYETMIVPGPEWAATTNGGA